jgi:formylglycine-generating enzyme required for sulfatase activity
MDLVDGPSLAALVEQAGPLEWRRGVALVARIARAVEHAHGRSVVHRDLKPQNVLVRAGDEPVVVDFGLARLVDQESSLTQTGVVVGTPLYLAPEMLRGESGPAGDIYALGGILAFVLTGEPPVEAPSVLELVRRIGAGEVARLGPPVPPAIERIRARAMAVSVAERYASAGELAVDLESALAEPEPPRYRIVPWAYAKVTAIIVVSAVAVLSRSPSREVTTTAPVVTAAPATSDAPRPAVVPDDERPARLPAGIVAGDRPGEFRNEKDGTILLYVPMGRFTMGVDENAELPGADPAHEVLLSAYFIAKHETRHDQFERFVRETGYVTNAEREGYALLRVPKDSHQAILVDGREIANASWRNPGGRAPPPGDHPVSSVCWADAVAYAGWAGLRLPTEAEWERAAGWDAKRRAARIYPWGASLPNATSAHANHADRLFLAAHPEFLATPGSRHTGPREADGFVDTAPVGSFPDGASPIGALDMAGNIREWCQDAWDEDFYGKPAAHAPDPVCDTPAAPTRCVRGGSFTTPPQGLRCAMRGHDFAAGSYDDVGFRLARSAQ